MGLEYENIMSYHIGKQNTNLKALVLCLCTLTEIMAVVMHSSAWLLIVHYVWRWQGWTFAVTLVSNWPSTLGGSLSNQTAGGDCGSGVWCFPVVYAPNFNNLSVVPKLQTFGTPSNQVQISLGDKSMIFGGLVPTKLSISLVGFPYLGHSLYGLGSSI